MDDQHRLTPANGTAAVESACAGLTALLWRQRDDLEQLLYRLVHQQLVLRSGDVRWLGRVDDEIERIVEGVRSNEVLRAIEVDELADVFGLPADTSLRELAAVLAQPWSDLLLEHRTALRRLQDEITETTADNRRLLKAGAAALNESLGRINGGSTTTYRSDGRVAAATSGPVWLDRQA